MRRPVRLWVAVLRPGVWYRQAARGVLMPASLRGLLAPSETCTGPAHASRPPDPLEAAANKGSDPETVIRTAAWRASESMGDRCG
jgi:hypothetical protein